MWTLNYLTQQRSQVVAHSVDFLHIREHHLGINSIVLNHSCNAINTINFNSNSKEKKVSFNSPRIFSNSTLSVPKSECRDKEGEMNEVNQFKNLISPIMSSAVRKSGMPASLLQRKILNTLIKNFLLNTNNIKEDSLSCERHHF